MSLPNKYTTEMKILPSSCDYAGKMGIFDTFKTFMDLANDHAFQLGVAQQQIAQDKLFWLTIKTRVRFTRRPDMSQMVKAETWPVKPGSLKTDRCYRLSDENGLLAEGRTEWAVLDNKTGRIANTSTVFPADLDFCQDAISFSDFPRVSVANEDFQIKGTYKVCSNDIDIGQHMNNTAYVRAMLGMFTTEELSQMDIKELSIIFKASAHEGDVLTMPVRRTDNMIETGLYFPDGKPAVLVQIIL